MVERLSKRSSAEGPYEVDIVRAAGELQFPCCGELWGVKADDITHVRCPDCGNLYVLTLKIALAEITEPTFATGTTVEFVSEWNGRAAGSNITLKVGTQFKVGHDPYGVTAIPEGHTLIEYSYRGDNKVHLVIENSYLKSVSETNVERADSEEPGRSSKDQGETTL